MSDETRLFTYKDKYIEGEARGTLEVCLLSLVLLAKSKLAVVVCVLVALSFRFVPLDLANVFLSWLDK